MFYIYDILCKFLIKKFLLELIKTIFLYLF